MTYAVIMAGGVGSRFWPLSTPGKPKQLLELFQDRSMIQLTVERILPLIPKENVRIVTIADQVDSIAPHVPPVDGQFIIEPFARNTAPCIGLSAVKLLNEDKDAVMIMLPADHLIQDEDGFREVLKHGVRIVDETDAILTVGIQPSRPETAYGYIQYERDELQSGLHRVVTFAEKPNRETAVRFLQTGEFLWNSGIFIWSARRVLSEMEEYLPEMFAALMEIKDALGTPEEEERIRRAYQSIKPISIDYGVMEHTGHAYVLQGKFDWSDVGSWEEVYRLSDKDENGNVTRGKVILHETKDSYIVSGFDKTVAAVGLENAVVVATEQGILVCPRNRVQDVKQVAEKVFKNQGNNAVGK